MKISQTLMFWYKSIIKIWNIMIYILKKYDKMIIWANLPEKLLKMFLQFICTLIWKNLSWKNAKKKQAKLCQDLCIILQSSSRFQSRLKPFILLWQKWKRQNISICKWLLSRSRWTICWNDWSWISKPPLYFLFQGSLQMSILEEKHFKLKMFLQQTLNSIRDKCSKYSLRIF